MYSEPRAFILPRAANETCYHSIATPHAVEVSAADVKVFHRCVLDDWRQLSRGTCKLGDRYLVKLVLMATPQRVSVRFVSKQPQSLCVERCSTEYNSTRPLGHFPLLLRFRLRTPTRRTCNKARVTFKGLVVMMIQGAEFRHIGLPTLLEYTETERRRS